MESVRQSCRPKHQVLTLKCYPKYQKGVQEVKPNPSELSYLLYYVSTRRSKLTKVGAFLEKRTARDVWRRRLGNVQVTLEILTALIEKVPRDLPIYARSVLTVIETVLRSNDISMVEDSIHTFETFCRHQDMAALAAEQEFANQFWDIVRTYVAFASINPPVQLNISSPQMAIRWRNAGLRAVKGVVSSDEGLAAGDEGSLKTILPVILENLYAEEDNLLSTLQSKLQESEKQELDPVRRRRVSNATVQTVDQVAGDPALAAQSLADADKQAELDVRMIALRCLERIIVSGSSRGQIRTTTNVIIQFILSKGPLPADTRENWATSLMELIAQWCPVQVRFIILVAAMELLLSTPAKEDSLDRGFTILSMINWLLKSPVNMIGLSVMDILLGLLQFLSSLLTPPENDESAEKQDTDSSLSPQRKKLLGLLEQSIGNLATHIYYGDQIIDLIRTVLTRFKSPHTGVNASSTVVAQHDALGTNANAASLKNSEAFSLATAKITALKAVKNILLVATSRTPNAAAGVEARNHVGVHVWEGTQWFLRESEREIRYAYADTFLTWLNLETNESDFKVEDASAKPVNSSLKREIPETGEKTGKRAASATVNQRERAILVAQSNFLRLLHLTVFDLAIECSAEESEITLLHLILTSLVDKLGINAIRFGLPTILKLQDDTALESMNSVPTKVNIGSLVFGYLLAISETFDLETFSVGREINGEVQKRRGNGFWLPTIRVPPISLDKIIAGNQHQFFQSGPAVSDILTPFRDTPTLVKHLEETYNLSMLSAQSPPGSPGRNIPRPLLDQGTEPSQQSYTLPAIAREQMLSSWSRETCLATVEKEAVKTWSINGSRSGTLGMRNPIHTNGANGNGDSPPSTTESPVQGAGAAGLQQLRRTSAPDSANTPNSSRGSPVRVNELRRVLSVNKGKDNRRLSPLRGRLDSNNSVTSSSSESMVSGFSVSEIDGEGSRPHSTIGQESDGMETPRASMLALSGLGTEQNFRLSAHIPPVPPLPPSLSLPGGFPNDSQRSLNSDRPSTAPGPRDQSPNGKLNTVLPPQNTLSRHKSRSSTGLSAALDDGSHEENPADDNQRRDVQNLLNGFLSPSHAEANGQSHVVGRSRSSRRSATGGIGRPPY